MTSAPVDRPDVDRPRRDGQRTIMIDGYNLALEKGTGVATYARNLSYECGKLGYRTEILYGTRSAASKDLMMREIAFFSSHIEGESQLRRVLRDMDHLLMSFGGTRAVPVPVTGKVITDSFKSRLPHFDAIWNAPDLFSRSHTLHQIYKSFLTVQSEARPDLMHWTYPLPIRMKGTKNIYTLHDLVPLRLPYTTLDHKRHYKRLIQRLVKEADHIVTVSENSKRDIMDLFDVPEDRITNTYQSVDIPAKLSEKPDDLVREEVEGAFGLKYKEYFLFLGAIEPKKNIARLIEAYLSSQVHAPLVIVGKMAWQSEQELQFLAESSNRRIEQVDGATIVTERVRRFDYAPFPLLVSLIRGAKAVTFPSLYEGFGLPILEAMQLGTPVLTSNVSSIPEITGDAALLVDPYDIRGIADALQILDLDDELRASLSAKGRLRAELFSPARHRDRLSAMYDRILAA